MLTGEMTIGSAPVLGTAGGFRAVDPSTGAELDPEFGFAAPADLERAAALAAAAFDTFRATSPEVRARLLERIADRIEERGDEITARGHAETGLATARLESERARTTGQLRLFAALLRGGTTGGVRVDPALPDRTPIPRLDIRQRLVPLGPVAVFGSSNFPLAFSTAGGDTASALAAGCPVIVKVHNAHPGTGMLVAHAVRDAVADLDLPEGVFSALIGEGNAIGAALVAHPVIKAVGFTGSRSGGLALVTVAQARPEPIPVYAEMSSTNPVFVLPSRSTADIAAEYVASLTLGSGQFCTNPGAVFVPRGDAGDAFLSSVHALLSESVGQTMLTSGIREAFERGVADVDAAGVDEVGRGVPGDGPNAPAPVVFATDARTYADEQVLQAEIFGAASLVIRYDDPRELPALAERLEGQLTATIQASPEEFDAVRALLPVLERKVGRILYNGWPTGVEVTHAMVHGGPYPATSDSRSTSVGTLAVARFQRPVSYQNLPDELLPAPVADANAWGEVRLVDGRYEDTPR